MKHIPMILEVVGNLGYHNQELIGGNKDLRMLFQETNKQF